MNKNEKRALIEEFLKFAALPTTKQTFGSALGHPFKWDDKTDYYQLQPGEIKELIDEYLDKAEHD